MENINRLYDVIVNLNKNTINHSIDSFTLNMQNSAYAVFGKQRKNNSNKSKNRNKGWFNKECYEARKKFNVSRNIFTRNKNEINKQAYLSDKREYTKIKRNSKRAFKTIEGKRVANLAKTDPKGFW